jgi:hypothetical protein
VCVCVRLTDQSWIRSSVLSKLRARLARLAHIAESIENFPLHTESDRQILTRLSHSLLESVCNENSTAGEGEGYVRQTSLNVIRYMASSGLSSSLLSASVSPMSWRRSALESFSRSSPAVASSCLTWEMASDSMIG